MCPHVWVPGCYVWHLPWSPQWWPWQARCYGPVEWQRVRVLWYHIGNMFILHCSRTALLQCQNMLNLDGVIQFADLFLYVWGFLSRFGDQRLALLTVLNCRMDQFMAVFGLVCSSFVTISQGTHWRSPFYPCGREEVKMVADGNQLASRTFSLSIVNCWNCLGFWQALANIIFLN